MKTRLVIDDNTVYEVDEECLSRMQTAKNVSNKNHNQNPAVQSDNSSMKNRNNNNRFSNNR